MAVSLGTLPSDIVRVLVVSETQEGPAAAFLKDCDFTYTPRLRA